MDESATHGSDDLVDTLAAGTRPRRSDADELEVGTTIGRYVIVSRIGAGAMGVVYAAYDPELDRKVAVKLLRGDRLEGEKADEARARIAREAQAMAKIAHPNVATVHDVGTYGDAVFIAMEFIDGSTLTAWLERPHTRKEILAVFVQAGRGLAAAHRAGLVHRDFKPDNVMIGPDGRPRVMDFGLARSSASEGEVETHAESSGESIAGSLSLSEEQLTQTGALMGTPAYMAPEQHLGGVIDHRSDQFSYCVALYEAVCGQRPFRGANVPALAFQVSSGKIAEPPRDVALPRWLRGVLWRGLSPKPDDRFPDMNALLAHLEHDRSTVRRSLPFVALAGLGLGIAGFAVARSGDVDQCSGASKHLEGVWDDAREQEMRNAMGSTGVGFASETSDRVAARIDAYVEDWVATREQACRTHQRGESSDTLLDREMTCLNERLVEVRALVDVLVEADADLVSRAVEATARLTPIDHCRDVEGLLAAVPPPDDPRVAAQLEQLRPRIAKVLALDRAGRFKEALALAHQVLEEAQGLGYRPLTARVRSTVGELQGEMGNLDDAEQNLLQAFWEGVSSHADNVATNSAASLASLYSDELGRPDDALLWAEHASAFEARKGGDEGDEALMRLAKGNAYFAKGAHDRAREEYARALEAARAVHGNDHPVIAAILNNLGNVHEAMGELERAKQLHEESLRLKEEILGPKHPDVAFSLHNLANLAYRDGDFDTAREYHLRALAIREAALGPEAMEVATSLTALAVVLGEAGERDRAIETLRRAREILEAGDGVDNPAFGVVLNNLADLELQAGHLDEARVAYERALKLFEGSFGPEHLNTSYPLSGLGRVLVEMGEAGKAAPLLERALKLRQVEGPLEYERAEAQLALARALWASGGDRARARELATEAAALDASAGGKYAELRRRAAQWLRAPDAQSSK
jgi:serine/threonine protein kinase/tetratricopeptide (TPR) repeat protein